MKVADGDKKFKKEMIMIGDSILSRPSNVSKAYVDRQDSRKVDKIEGKTLSSNDFTNDYKSKIDSAVHSIISSGDLIESQNGVVNLTPEVLKCLASGVIQRTNDGPTYFLRIHTERLSSDATGSFYVSLSDSGGNGIFGNAGSILIYHMAIDIGDPTRYLFSVGYKKDSSTVHQLNVVSSNIITLGAKNAQGTQVIQNTDNRDGFVMQAALCIRL